MHMMASGGMVVDLERTLQCLLTCTQTTAGHVAALEVLMACLRKCLSAMRARALAKSGGEQLGAEGKADSASIVNSSSIQSGPKQRSRSTAAVTQNAQPLSTDLKSSSSTGPNQTDIPTPNSAEIRELIHGVCMPLFVPFTVMCVY